MCGFNRQKPQMIIYAKLQSSRVRHQYGIFGGKSQTSFLQNATPAGSEEERLFSQAREGYLCCQNGTKNSKKLHLDMEPIPIKLFRATPPTLAGHHKLNLN